MARPPGRAQVVFLHARLAEAGGWTPGDLTVTAGEPVHLRLVSDDMLHSFAIWQAGGYITYHHDMFQFGYGSPSCPPEGVPDPEFSSYHRQVLEFISQGARYRPRYARNGQRAGAPARRIRVARVVPRRSAGS